MVTLKYFTSQFDRGSTKCISFVFWEVVRLLSMVVDWFILAFTSSKGLTFIGHICQKTQCLNKDTLSVFHSRPTIQVWGRFSDSLRHSGRWHSMAAIKPLSWWFRKEIVWDCKCCSGIDFPAQYSCRNSVFKVTQTQTVTCQVNFADLRGQYYIQCPSEMFIWMKYGLYLMMGPPRLIFSYLLWPVAIQCSSIAL